MASEIKYSSKVTANKGNLSITKDSGTLSANLSGAKFYNAIQAVGTTYEAVAIGDIASAGMAWFKNVDTTNYVEVGVEVSAAFYPLVKLKPGEVAQFRLATTTLFARANTAAVNLEVMLLED